MDDKPHWLDQPRHVKLLWRGFLAVLALSVLAEFFVPLHPHFEIDFWISCLVRLFRLCGHDSLCQRSCIGD